MRPGDVAPRPQLLTYPDSLGGNLARLADVLEGPLAGLFRGVHILPPFPSSGDRGFAPLTYTEIDARFGDWADIRRIGERHDVLIDLMINHISRQSPQFRDFEQRGRRSPAADLFITLDKIWPNGDVPEADVARMFLRKPDAPFSAITIAETGEQERVWTTFGTADWSEQIDLDVTSRSTRELLTEWLRRFAAERVRIVRLDAVGYVVKKPGSTCFMVEPEIYEFLAWVSDVAASFGLVILPEVHDVYATHERLAAHDMWTYDFVLPGLILHALQTADASRLGPHLQRMPRRVFTTLDCHDGIPIRPDLDGILRPDEMATLADRIERAGGNVNRILSNGRTTGVDVHQLNCTYYSALECDDERFLAARAIQLFAPGVPQIYYVGLLAGKNDHAAVERTGEGRAINRHDYGLNEIGIAMGRPVVRRLLDLVSLRNNHPAFDGEPDIGYDGRAVTVGWQHRGTSTSLEVDFSRGRASLTTDGRSEGLADWLP